MNFMKFRLNTILFYFYFSETLQDDLLNIMRSSYCHEALNIIYLSTN